MCNTYTYIHTYIHMQVTMRWPICGKSDWCGLAGTLWDALDDERACRAAAELFIRIHRIDERSCRSVMSRALLYEAGWIGTDVSDRRMAARRKGYARFER
jgi:hypothetical protein